MASTRQEVRRTRVLRTESPLSEITSSENQVSCSRIFVYREMVFELQHLSQQYSTLRSILDTLFWIQDLDWPVFTKVLLLSM